MAKTTTAPLRKLLDGRSAKHLDNPITLSTGKLSNFYFDCKLVTLSSDGAPLVGEAFLDALSAMPEQPTAVGGLTLGADPIIGAMMLMAHRRGQALEGFYVRKEPKKHGTKLRIENPQPAGTIVVIVDDVVTTGDSLLQAVTEARKAGCKVVGAIALVDRDEEGGAALTKISSVVPHYISLYTRHDFPRIERVAETCPTTISEQRSGQETSTLATSGM